MAFKCSSIHFTLQFVQNKLGKTNTHKKRITQKKTCSTLQDRRPVEATLPGEPMLWAWELVGRQSLVEPWCMRIGKGESNAIGVKESALNAWQAILHWPLSNGDVIL